MAGKFNDTVELLVIDRSLDELMSIVEQKLRGKTLTKLYTQFAAGWICNNASNFIKADNCFKIITCDPMDDTVGQFASTMAGVGNALAKQKYDTNEYKLFFESL